MRFMMPLLWVLCWPSIGAAGIDTDDVITKHTVTVEIVTMPMDRLTDEIKQKWDVCVVDDYVAYCWQSPPELVKEMIFQEGRRNGK
jgi:hypothetical protein